MIRQLADARPALLARLAATWLEAGAHGVSLWEDGALIAAWPADQPPAEALSAPLRRGRQRLGELRVSGLGGPQVQARLDADAAMLIELACAEREVDSVTAALIESQDQLLALYRINQATGSALHTEQSLQLIAQEAAGLLQADAVFFYLSAASGASVESYRGDGSQGPALPSELCARLTAASVECSLDAADEPELATAGVGQLTLLPMQVRGTLIAGAMGVIHGPQGVDAPILKRARAVADLAGGLVERGMLYQDQLTRMRMHTEMDLARTVQRNLLPARPPTVPGLDIFARAIPALQVGGDLYDFVIAQDGSLVFTLGDVTGKGIPAALIMAMTRTALRTKAAFLPRPDPLTIITRANQDLYDDFTMVEMFATVIVGQIAPSERRLRLANAGHAPVILRRVGEAPRLIEAEGIPLGVLPEPLCELQSEPFGPGDLLVVASDGITEAQAGGGEMYGIERLMDLVECYAERPAHVIGEAIFNAVHRFALGQPQSDDQTLMVIKGTS